MSEPDHTSRFEGTALLADSPKKTPKPTPFTWRSAPPQSIPERLDTAAELELLLANPAWSWEVAHRYVASSCYVLSGVELERVIQGLIRLLKGDG
jgi:hypothetical protein